MSDEIAAHRHAPLTPLSFFLWFDNVRKNISLRNDVQQFREGLFKSDIPTFDEDSVREAVLKAVSPRDYRNSGSIWIKQSPRMLDIESPGGFPDGITPDTMRERQKLRNRRIAEALARCGLVERSGQGMNLMFRQILIIRMRTASCCDCPARSAFPASYVSKSRWRRAAEAVFYRRPPRHRPRPSRGTAA